MTELAAPQISSLMEALPGIAAVLRSPVANAIVALSRAGAGLEDFRPAEAEELLRYGVRRNLLTQDEVDRILAEIREVVSHRPAKAGALVAEKPKKAPGASTPAVEHKPAMPPAPRAAVPVVSARPVVKSPVKPAAKAPVKPAAKPPLKQSGKAPAKAVASKVKGKSAVTAKKAPAKPAPKKLAPKKPAPKKPAPKKGHR